ncbi:MAG: glycoside hydrolase family 5 protein [Lapillicoccus sp.]
MRLPRGLRRSRPLQIVVASVVLLVVAGLVTGIVVRRNQQTAQSAPSARSGTSGQPGQATGGVGTSPSTGWLHTDGTRILDEAGRQVVLRGVDDSTQTKTEKHTPDEAEFANISSWGMNTLRLVVQWAKLQPRAPTATDPGWSKDYLSRIDAIVQLAASHHIYVILDMHQAGWANKLGGSGLPDWLYPELAACPSGGCGASKTAHCEFLLDQAEKGVPVTPQEGMITAWTELATRYKDNATVIGADLFNEPQPCKLPGVAKASYHVPTASSNPLDDFYLKAGTAVAAVNPRLLLVYEDNAYESYEAGGFALAHRLDLPNAVYSSHFYADSWSQGNGPQSCKTPGGPTGQDVMQAHLDRAQGWDQPMYVGEFDGFHLTNQPKCPYSTSETQAAADTATMMDYLRTNSVSWTLWQYSNSQPMVQPSGSAKQPLLANLQKGL